MVPEIAHILKKDKALYDKVTHTNWRRNCVVHFDFIWDCTGMDIEICYVRKTIDNHKDISKQDNYRL